VTAPELVPGEIFAAKYAVRALLRHLGTSATYHAITAPNREVALKLFDSAIRADVLATFPRYEAITNGLPGNTVMHIVDSGHDDEKSVAFTVTDLSVQPSLEQLVELCPLSPTEMVVLVRNIARAVDHAHANGMLHHALKPTNLFVGPAPAFELRVADFGANLSRSVAAPGDHASLWVPWMAPEQVTRAHMVGPSADVFSTALIAFFSLTGKSYWRTRQAGDFDLAAFQREIEGYRASVSERAQEFAVTLDPKLDAVFARALSGQPRDRFGTLSHLAEALAAALEGRPIPESPPGLESPSIPPPPAAMYDVLSSIVPTDSSGHAGDDEGNRRSWEEEIALDRPFPSQGNVADAEPFNRETSSPPVARRSGGSSAWTILIAAVSVVLIGLVGWAATRLGRLAPPPGAESTELTAVPAPEPAAARTVEAPAAPVKPAAPPTASIPLPTAVASAPAAVASAAAPAEKPTRSANSSALRIGCKPECDTVYVDGKSLSSWTEPLEVAPGKHIVTVTKSGAKAQTKQLYTVAGQDHELAFEFALPHTTAPAAHPAAPAKKPCGKFLKRCN
jgi:serine/threonine protein kinase